jgi:hypothetical protein
MDVAFGVEAKCWTNKSRGSTQIKSRGPDLGAPARVALRPLV